MSTADSDSTLVENSSSDELETEGDIVEDEHDSTENYPAKPQIPDVSVLEDRMPEWFRSTKTFAGLFTLLVAAFSFLSYRPLWHSDLWGHLSYGRHIWESGIQVLWGNEPLMPLSQGIPFVDTAWLSQLIGYGTYEVLGVAGLQFLFAASITTCLGRLAWRFYQRSGDPVVTVLGLAAFVMLAWHQMFVSNGYFQILIPSALIRPQLAGWVCFVTLLTILTSRRWRTVYWVAIPAMFALWANLHGSFLVGLTMLGCFALGRGIDIERRTKKIGAIFKDQWTVRYILLLELSAVAVLLNPYGLQIYSTVFEFSNNPNLAALIEWEPLTLRTSQGVAAAFAGLVLMFLFRWSPRRVSSTEVLLLAGFGGLTLYYSRFLTWWAPIAAYVMVLHGSAVLKKDRPKLVLVHSQPPLRSSMSTVVWLGVMWICFALTPIGSRVVHGRDADFSKSVGEVTPVRATEYLKQRAEANELPRGLIFNSYEWGDYLLWAGPRNVPVFVASHVQFIPETIWGQYFDISTLAPDYNDLLNTHGVNVVMLSKSMHENAIEGLKRDGRWKTDYEDERAVIFIRRKPI